MKPWLLLGSARIPGDGGEMRLYQRDTEFSIRIGSYELMNSRMHGSEDALASLVCDRLSEPAPRILVGGLGMSFTLQAVLERCGPSASVVVSELVPEVVTWHRGPLSVVSRGAIEDPRVVIREEDVARVMRAERNAFDAILLDVDNGPAGLTSKQNDRLYESAGLAVAKASLRAGGMLAIWSAAPDERFTRRLKDAGFATEEVQVRGRDGKRGPRHVIWIATKA
jgi:spermidine synthase